MVRKVVAVKKYVVTLSDEERNQLNAMIRKGNTRAAATESAYPAESRRLGRRRGMERQPDRRRSGDQRRYGRENSSTFSRGRPGWRPARLIPRTPPGDVSRWEAEAKLIALTRSPPPPGRVRWTLVLLEDQVVERGIVARASDNTIGRR